MTESTFGTVTDDNAPVVVETTPSVCRHCKEPAVFCEAHASELVAQAFAEDEANTLEQVTRGAERSLRRSDANTPNRAAAVREVLVRWFGRGALNVAREVVKQLETSK